MSIYESELVSKVQPITSQWTILSTNHVRAFSVSGDAENRFKLDKRGFNRRRMTHMASNVYQALHHGFIDVPTKNGAYGLIKYAILTGIV